MSESGSGWQSQPRQRGAARDGALSLPAQGRKPAPRIMFRGRSGGPIASTVGVVRDTLYATFDALRGRYDR